MIATDIIDCLRGGALPAAALASTLNADLDEVYGALVELEAAALVFVACTRTSRRWALSPVQSPSARAVDRLLATLRCTTFGTLPARPSVAQPRRFVMGRRA